MIPPSCCHECGVCTHTSAKHDWKSRCLRSMSTTFSLLLVSTASVLRDTSSTSSGVARGRANAPSSAVSARRRSAVGRDTRQLTIVVQGFQKRNAEVQLHEAPGNLSVAAQRHSTADGCELRLIASSCRCPWPNQNAQMRVTQSFRGGQIWWRGGIACKDSGGTRHHSGRLAAALCGSLRARPHLHGQNTNS